LTGALLDGDHRTGALKTDVDVSVVVPVFNSMGFLSRLVPPMIDMAARRGRVELIFVDNGSTDGSGEYLATLGNGILLLSRPDDSLGQLRNNGARHARGRYLSFLDSDCEIDDTYFDAAIIVLAQSGAVATGHEVDVPRPCGWIESAWHDLHFQSRARQVEYLNSGNFFISRAAFEDVGGFREDLATGEDAEIGQRINRAGHRIFADPRVRALHHGNPKSVRQFYRRQVWHGIGMFGTVNFSSIDRPTAMMFMQLAAIVAGVGAIAGLHRSLIARVALAIGLQAVVPMTTVIFRLSRTRNWRAFLPGIPLYWLYYVARIQALFLIMLRRRYRK
jgi:glycosyltransferase involved in cell wall biosynthesis